MGSERDDLTRMLVHADRNWCEEFGDEFSTEEFMAYLADAVLSAGWSRPGRDTSRGDG